MGWWSRRGIRNQAGYLLGNRQLVRPMTAKNFQAVKKEVDRVVSLAENRDRVCIGTGCLPFETDPQMVLKTKEYVLSKNVP